MRLLMICACLCFWQAIAAAQSEDEEGAAVSTMSGPKLVNGKAEGVSSYELSDGSKGTTTWHEGQRHGPFERRFSNGIVAEEGVYQMGQRSGPWVFRNEEGNVTFTKGYVLGRWHGIAKKYGMGGNKWRVLRSITYVLGTRHGPSARWDPKTHTEVYSLYVGGRLAPEQLDEIILPRPWSEYGAIQVLSPRGLNKPSPEWEEIKQVACVASETLMVPVIVGDSRVSCNPGEKARRKRAKVWHRSDGLFTPARESDFAPDR